LIRSAAGLNPGSNIKIRFHDGEVHAKTL